MLAVIIILHVIVCFVLILVILLQAGRGSGLSWGSFGGSPQSFLGTKSASFLAKATSACAIVFLLTCIFLNIFESKRSRSLYAGKNSNVSQVDLEKIKKALDQAKDKTSQSPATSQAADSATSSTSSNQAAPVAAPDASKTPDTNSPPKP